MHEINFILKDMTEFQSRRCLSFTEVDYREKTTPQCGLCHHPHRTLSSPEKWTSESAKKFVDNLGVGPQCLICTACRKDITKCIKNNKFKPRWVAKEIITCCVMGKCYT